jgi:hypothetical protein
LHPYARDLRVSSAAMIAKMAKSPVQAMIICVRGGLEPLAYILHSSADTWLDLPTQAVEP